MPISNKTFESAPDNVNPKLLDLFIKHPNNAYSYSELDKKFCDKDKPFALILDLLILSTSNRIEQRSIDGENYYRLIKK
jgi:hypothetical protein